MTEQAENVLRTFPPRPLNPDERALVATWLASACDIASAYVSERRGDDPALYRRIVVTTGPQRTPSYLVHAPTGMDCWLLSEIKSGEVQRFDSLAAALNAIRPVFRQQKGAAVAA